MTSLFSLKVRFLDSSLLTYVSLIFVFHCKKNGWIYHDLFTHALIFKKDFKIAFYRDSKGEGERNIDVKKNAAS